MRGTGSAAIAVLVLAATAAGQENILVIMADDMGVDKVGAYGVGQSPPSTPVIDSLAANGVRFENAWAHPLCTPTRVAIQTGLFPFRTGLGSSTQDGEPGLSLAHVIIPEALDLLGRGYSHAYFGKWHLSNDTVGGPLGPNLAGYSHFAGVAANLGIDPGDYFQWEKIVDGVVFTQTGYITSDTVDDALGWIQQSAEPWFAFVGFNAPHAPAHEPPSHLHSVDLTAAGSPKLNPVPYQNAVIEAMDTEIGRLLRGIAPSLHDTCVIFLSDNGSYGPKGKGTAYEGGVRVPLIVSGPSVVNPGRTHSSLVCVNDLYDTIVEMAAGTVSAPTPTDRRNKVAQGLQLEPFVSAEPPSSALPLAADSISFLPYLRDPGAQSLRDFAWAEVFWPNVPATPVLVRRAIRDERYKIMINIGLFDPPLPEGTFFFDLVSDPGETTNLLEGPLSFEQSHAFQALLQTSDTLLDS